MTQLEILKEEQRMQCWINVAVAMAQTQTCRRSDVMTGWADDAVDAFDKKFNSEEK